MKNSYLKIDSIDFGFRVIGNGQGASKNLLIFFYIIVQIKSIKYQRITVNLWLGSASFNGRSNHRKSRKEVVTNYAILPLIFDKLPPCSTCITDELVNNYSLCFSGEDDAENVSISKRITENLGQCVIKSVSCFLIIYDFGDISLRQYISPRQNLPLFQT